MLECSYLVSVCGGTLLLPACLPAFPSTCSLTPIRFPKTLFLSVLPALTPLLLLDAFRFPFPFLPVFHSFTSWPFFSLHYCSVFQGTEHAKLRPIDFQSHFTKVAFSEIDSFFSFAHFLPLFL